MTEQAIKYPVRSFSAGKMQSAVFEHKNTNSQGEDYLRESVQLQKSRKDKEGNWINENFYLLPQEIPDAILVLRKAYEACRLRQEAEHTQ